MWKNIIRFWTRVFSENDVPSCKRIVGTICILACLCFTGYLIFKDGATVIVQNLIQTEFISGTALIGLHSVTSIWKGNKDDGTEGDGSMTINETLEE